MTREELEVRVHELIDSRVRVRRDVVGKNQFGEVFRIWVVLQTSFGDCELSEERVGGSLDARRRNIVHSLVELVMDSVDLHDCLSVVSGSVLDS